MPKNKQIVLVILRQLNGLIPTVSRVVEVPADIADDLTKLEDLPFRSEGVGTRATRHHRWAEDQMNAERQRMSRTMVEFSTAYWSWQYHWVKTGNSID